MLERVLVRWFDYKVNNAIESYISSHFLSPPLDRFGLEALSKARSAA